jgi:hypothetical protein
MAETLDILYLKINIPYSLYLHGQLQNGICLNIDQKSFNKREQKESREGAWIDLRVEVDETIENDMRSKVK